jgi:glutathione reductase (NADPH)
MNHYHFDAVLVGSGTAAWFAVDGLVKAGRKVAIVDERPYGGTCALRGCQPKKYLVANAEAVAMATQLLGNGIRTAPTSDWAALQRLKNDFLEGRSDNEVKTWRARGVATFFGRALFTGEDEVCVGEQRLSADHIILATGAVPRRSDIPGAELVHDSEYFLDMAEMPSRLVFIGGGFISFEFAHVAVRTGAVDVTILHRSNRPLKQFDPDIVAEAVEASRCASIDIVLNESVQRAERDGSVIVMYGTEGECYEAELVIEATGRVPNLSVLEGDFGGVEHSAAGVHVNEFLQSVSNPKVYAIGDCAATGAMLAPVADEQGKTVVHNILEDNTRTIDYSVVPSCVFTIPSIARVGLGEAEAAEQGYDFRVNFGRTAGWPSSRRIGEQHGAYKVLISNTTDEILGAHLIRHNASEVINLFALAIRYKIKADALKECMWGYPTYSSDIKYMVK